MAGSHHARHRKRCERSSKAGTKRARRPLMTLAGVLSIVQSLCKRCYQASGRPSHLCSSLHSPSRGASHRSLAPLEVWPLQHSRAVLYSGKGNVKTSYYMRMDSRRGDMDAWKGAGAGDPGHRCAPNMHAHTHTQVPPALTGPLNG